VKRRSLWPLAGLLGLVAAMLWHQPAWAVVPAVVGPIQALVAILPQLLAMLGAAAVAMLKPETYKALFKFLWHQKILSLGIIAGIALIIWAVPKVFGGSVAEEQSGVAWAGMRGGPERTGAVPGARGPQEAAKIEWVYAGRKREQVDCSPAVVGNRVFTSSAVLNLFDTSNTGTGVIYCRDTKGGGVVWKYAGEDMDTKLASIFSSPAVGGVYTDAKREDGSPEEGRYLAVGEGYHVDINCRFLCLDLEPVKRGKKPELKWFKQATSHVESSPCIHKCTDDVWRTWVGGGDDGFWCVELETGKLAWMVEGTPAYYLAANCKRLEEVRALAGKLVELDVTVDRRGATMTDPGQVLITEVHGEIKEVTEVPPVTTTAGEGFRRIVVGRVALGETPTVEDGNTGKRIPLKDAGAVRVEIPRYYTDVESSPVAVDLPVDPKQREGEKRTLVMVGNGLAIKHENFGVAPRPDGAGRDMGTCGVVCFDGITGEEKWFYPVKNPLFTPPTVVQGVTVKPADGQGDERLTDVVLVGYGEGDFVNLGAGPGHILCLDIHDVSEGKPRKLWEVETGSTVLGTIAVKDELAYACSMDGNFYVAGVTDGALRKKIKIGAPMVCSPSVTEDSVYLVTKSGMAYCIDRKSYATRWKFSVSQTVNMFASPAVSRGRVFLGTPDQGMAALCEDPDAGRRPIKPFDGPGGDASRAGMADIRGLPSVEGEKAQRKWREYWLRGRTVPGPVAACGGAIYLQLKPAGEAAGPPLLACVDAENGSERWAVAPGGPVTALSASEQRVYALVGMNGREQNLYCVDAADGGKKVRTTPAVHENGREQNLHCLDAADGWNKVWSTPAVYLKGVLSLARDRVLVARGEYLECLDAETGAFLWKNGLAEVCGPPATAYALVVAAGGGDEPRLVCLEDGRGREIWRTALPGAPLGAVTVAGGLALVACREGQGDAGGYALVGCSLLDGELLWKKPLPAAPTGHLVASDEHVLVAAADGKVYPFGTDGESLREEGLVVGSNPQPPVLVGGLTVLAGRKRLWCWNLANSLPAWTFRGQGLMGEVLAPPVVMNETVYVVTEKRGLVVVGENPVVKRLTTLEWVKVPMDDAWALATGLRTVKALEGADPAKMAKLMAGDSADPQTSAEKTELAGQIRTAIEAEEYSLIRPLMRLEGVSLPLRDALALAKGFESIEALREATAADMTRLMTDGSADPELKAQKGKLAEEIHAALHAGSRPEAGKETSR
jgi:outer membrane protein assembly factor BamB